MPVAEQAQTIVEETFHHLEHVRSGYPGRLEVQVEDSFLDKCLQIDEQVFEMECQSIATPARHTTVVQHRLYARQRFLRELEGLQATVGRCTVAVGCQQVALVRLQQDLKTV